MQFIESILHEVIENILFLYEMTRGFNLISIFICILVGVSVVAVVSMGVITLTIVLCIVWKIKKRSRRVQRTDSNEESRVSPQESSSEISSKMEKSSKRSIMKKRGRKDGSEGSAEDAPQEVKSKSEKLQARYLNKKKRKSLDLFGSSQVAPATDFELTQTNGNVGHTSKKTQETRHKSLPPDTIPKPSRKLSEESPSESQRRTSVVDFSPRESAKKSHRQRTTNIGQTLGLVSPTENESSSGGQTLAKNTSKRRQPLGQFSESLQTSGPTTSGTGTTYPNDTSESAATHSKQKRKTLSIPSDVNHTLQVNVGDGTDIQPLVVSLSISVR